ncbi:MAG: hypothetical protein K0U36_03395, partial [Alphaproteobacteria bacterium]|nr:hypothetical protein [Alphaproteobacteria bacterium]
PSNALAQSPYVTGEIFSLSDLYPHVLEGGFREAMGTWENVLLPTGFLVQPVMEMAQQQGNLFESQRASYGVHFFIAQIKPDFVAIFGCTGRASLAAIHATKQGIPWMMLETGFFLDSFVVDTNGLHCLPKNREIESRWHHQLASHACIARGEEFRIEWVTKRESREEQVSDNSRLAQLRRFKGQSKLLFIIGQVPSDTSVAISSKRFLGMMDFAQQICGLLPKGWKAVIKPHPSGKNLLNAIRRPNVVIVENLNIHDLFDLSDAVCTLCSNVGFEAVLAGKPVLVAADPHYAHKGMTIDFGAPDTFLQALHAAESFVPNDTLIANYLGYLLTDYLVHTDDIDALRRKIARAKESLAAADDADAMFDGNIPPQVAAQIDQVRHAPKQHRAVHEGLVQEGVSLGLRLAALLDQMQGGRGHGNILCPADYGAGFVRRLCRHSGFRRLDIVTPTERLYTMKERWRHFRRRVRFITDATLYDDHAIARLEPQSYDLILGIELIDNELDPVTIVRNAIDLLRSNGLLLLGSVSQPLVEAVVTALDGAVMMRPLGQMVESEATLLDEFVFQHTRQRCYLLCRQGNDSALFA